MDYYFYCFKSWESRCILSPLLPPLLLLFTWESFPPRQTCKSVTFANDSLAVGHLSAVACWLKYPALLLSVTRMRSQRRPQRASRRRLLLSVNHHPPSAGWVWHRAQLHTLCFLRHSFPALRQSSGLRPSLCLRNSKRKKAPSFDDFNKYNEVVFRRRED